MVTEKITEAGTDFPNEAVLHIEIARPYELLHELELIFPPSNAISGLLFIVGTFLSIKLSSFFVCFLGLDTMATL